MSPQALKEGPWGPRGTWLVTLCGNADLYGVTIDLSGHENVSKASKDREHEGPRACHLSLPSGLCCCILSKARILMGLPPAGD